MPEATKKFDKILDQTFAYAKKIGKEFYFKEWRPNQPQCPAFDGEIIHITREGWDHTIKMIRRTHMDVLGRLFVLERAKKLLEEARAFQEYREDTSKEQKVEYWVFSAITEGVNIKVVVRSVGGGHKHFLSVVRKGTVEKEIEDVHSK